MLRCVEVVDAELVFDVFDAFFFHTDGLFTFVDFVVNVLGHAWDDLCEDVVELRCAVYWSGDNQWGAGFVDEDGVYFVDNGVVVSTLHEVA